eukprot:PLAT9831.1.p1 GENE.PLAT9831.1~~PLAT9831.1.p1  ORF type:complete len:497 (-),score=217.55 PLAT9831.1:112-1602(-)
MESSPREIEAPLAEEVVVEAEVVAEEFISCTDGEDTVGGLPTREEAADTAEEDGKDEAGDKTDKPEEAEAHETPKELDLVFIVDCTGSMGSYIHAAQDNMRSIIESLIAYEKCDVRFNLICYRDHPPQDRSYVTRVFEFTSSLAKMKEYVNTMAASGGGDGPEAVAAGMYEATQLPWRKTATKIAIIIADAPPHGLPGQSDGFPDGCPMGHDPIAIARDLAAREIVLYTVGCEPALGSYALARDFFVAVAEITGGQAVALSSASALADVILFGAQEEMQLESLMASASTDLQSAIEAVRAAGGDAEAEEAALDGVWSKMADAGVRTKQMQYTSIPKSEAAAMFKGHGGLREAHSSLHSYVRSHRPDVAEAHTIDPVPHYMTDRPGSWMSRVSSAFGSFFGGSSSSSKAAAAPAASAEHAMRTAPPMEASSYLGSAVDAAAAPAPAMAGYASVMPPSPAAVKRAAPAGAPYTPVSLDEGVIKKEQVRRMMSKYASRH